MPLNSGSVAAWESPGTIADVLHTMEWGILWSKIVEDAVMKEQSKQNCKVYEYESLIYDAEGKGGAYTVFPYDIRKEFGKGRVKVHATFDGEPYDGSIVNMGVKNADGSVCYIIGIRKDIRSKIGKQSGDRVLVTVVQRE